MPELLEFNPPRPQRTPRPAAAPVIIQRSQLRRIHQMLVASLCIQGLLLLHAATMIVQLQALRR